VLGSVARPTAQLLGYHRVTLEPGESTTVTFDVPTTRFAFTDRSMTRIVEPGDVEVWVGAHAADSVVRVVAEGIADLDEPNDLPDDAPTPDGAATPPTTRKLLTITGAPHEVTPSDPRWVRATT
jgi:beta-glucosidase